MKARPTPALWCACWLAVSRAKQNAFAAAGGLLGVCRLLKDGSLHPGTLRNAALALGQLCCSNPECQVRF